MVDLASPKEVQSGKNNIKSVTPAGLLSKVGPGYTKLNDNNKLKLDIQWPDIANPFPGDSDAGLGKTSISYRMDYDAANGSGNGLQLGHRLVDGSPSADTSVYAFKVKSITNAISGTVGSPGHSNNVEHIAIEGEASIAPNISGGMCQGVNALARHWDSTASGKLLGIECLVENKDRDLGSDRIDEAERHEGIRINSDGDFVASSAIQIAGGNSQGWHNGIAIKKDRIQTRAFWYENKAIIDQNGFAAFGFDETIDGASVRAIQNDGVNPGVLIVESALDTGVCAKVQMTGQDDGGTRSEYAEIQGQVVTNTAGSEDGELGFVTLVGGSQTTQMDMRSGVRVGTPTGVFPGAGKLNAEDLQIDGVSCTTSSGTTGGSGSAGAGNNYIELDVGGTVYKVLHDGTL